MSRTRACILITLLFYFLGSPLWANPKLNPNSGITISGNAPSVAAENNMVYLVYATGDSIQFSSSSNRGMSFSPAITAGIISRLSKGGGRGPKIVIAGQKLVIAVADLDGNIFSFSKNKSGTAWEKGNQVNDVNEIAKEGFVALSANRQGDVFAVWLDLRNNKKNKIAGAKSLDGGKTWTANKIIYSSPEGTVCECCKPSIAVKDQLVVVMFRNFEKGNRDMYISQSTNGGKDFGQARKLGTGTWQLNACPMDGGGLVISENGAIQTTWRREGNIYSCIAGKEEELVSAGTQCTISGKEGKYFLAFVKDGKVYCRFPDLHIVELGKGIRPELTLVDTETVFCAWEDKGQVNYQVVH